MFKSKLLKLFRKSFGPWETPPPLQKPRPTFRPTPEALEERWLLNAASDTLIWNPQGGSQNAAVGTNYYDLTTGTQITAGQLPNGPTATNGIILSGSQASYNKPITVNQTVTVEYLTVQTNYNNTLTITGSFSALNTMDSDAVRNGTTLTIVSSSNLGITLAGNNLIFAVFSGGTVNLRDAPGNTSSNTFITSGDTGDYISNAGTVTWVGTAVASGQQGLTDAIEAPVLNTGTFTVDGGTNGNANAVGAMLNVDYTVANTNGVSFYQTGGSLNLKNGATINCLDGYSQTGGQITSDSSVCTLGSTGPGASGTINIGGGKVIVDTVANSIGTLNFQGISIAFNGELDVSGLMTGGNSTQSDVLNCGDATVTFGQNSLLDVGTTGTGTLGTGNQWNVMQYGSRVNTWGQKPILPTGMNVSTGGTKVLVSN